jgi:hypothetical protein
MAKSKRKKTSKRKPQPKDAHGIVLQEGDYIMVEDEPGSISSLDWDDDPEFNCWVMEAGMPYLEAVDVAAGEPAGYWLELCQTSEGVWEDVDTGKVVKVEVAPPPGFEADVKEWEEIVKSRSANAGYRTASGLDLSEPWPGSPGRGEPLPPTHPHLYGTGKRPIHLFDHVNVFLHPGWIKGQVFDVRGNRYLVKTKDGYMLVHEHYIEFDRKGPNRGSKAWRLLMEQKREGERYVMGLVSNPEPSTRKLKSKLLR